MFTPALGLAYEIYPRHSNQDSMQSQLMALQCRLEHMLAQ